MTVIEQYQFFAAKYTSESKEIQHKINRLSWIRLSTLVLIIGLFFIDHLLIDSSIIFSIIGALLLIFLLEVRTHQRLKIKLKQQTIAAELNQDEIDFLNSGISKTATGERFQSAQHAYSSDLDLFGNASLYPFLNRTTTFRGEDFLGQFISQKASSDEIEKRQLAIQELNLNFEWRQSFQVTGKMGNDSQSVLQLIQKWHTSSSFIPIITSVISYLFPLLGLLSMIALGITQNANWFSIGILIFIVNLTIFGSIAKQIHSELGQLDRIDQTIRSYSELLALIERHDWNSAWLRERKEILQLKDGSASEHLLKLSQIFSGLESIQNGFAAVTFNGTVFYHIHVFRKLIQWKKKQASQIDQWIEVIGEIDALISFSNFSYNNPDFVFPKHNSKGIIRFENLGHPLILAHKRISNTIDLSRNPFVILTGSNMSGKSTFLRTLGINMVLANAGSAVCASEADFESIDLLVSMRQSDSLTDSESYFFAEVKRLKFIVEELKNGKRMILLDEILRGTNSDDKRSGTIAVVEKMVAEKAIGMIATHDLEVCDTTLKHTDYLINNCFEVEIINDELQFDYRLRDGICKNKSATFLMKKMGIVE